MPFANCDDPLVWASWYNPPFTHLNRNTLYGENDRDFEGLLAGCIQAGMLPSHNILIIGGAYGWFADFLNARGYPNVVVTDTSVHIQNNKTGNVQGSRQILNESAANNNSRGNIRRAFGAANSTIHFGLTEDVLPVYTDAELGNYLPAFRGMCQRVLHWISPLDPGNSTVQNWKTMADWKTFCAPDYVMQRGTSQLYSPPLSIPPIEST